MSTCIFIVIFLYDIPELILSIKIIGRNVNQYISWWIIEITILVWEKLFSFFFGFMWDLIGMYLCFTSLSEKSYS